MSSNKKGGGDAPDVESVDCAVTVVVRSRPINDRERKLSSGVCLEFSGGHTVKLKHPTESSRSHTFTFDHAYNSTEAGSEDFIPQERVFDDIGKRVLNSAFDGFNTCIFAYGQTGSGKTYTMMGPGGGRDSKLDPGLIPRICTTLFDHVTEVQDKESKIPMSEIDVAPPSLECKVEVTYLEIYNERVRCLLNPKKDNLKVRQHPVTGVYVEELTKMLVGSYEEVFNLMNDGNNARTVASTNMNDRSSRSHAIFSLILTQTRTIRTREGETVSDRVSRVNLVDLAGSERAKATGAEGDRLKEGAQINQSLTTLGLVISGLAEQSKQRTSGDTGGKKVFIPYRDSTLTWLLKENLGGNSKTFMVSTLSPAGVNYDETLSTLRYADRAKSIVTRACVNEDPNAKMIRELRAQIEAYKARLLRVEEEVQVHIREKEELIAKGGSEGRMSSGVDTEAVAVATSVSPSPAKVPQLALGRLLGAHSGSPAAASPSHTPMYTPRGAIDTVLTARGQQPDDDDGSYLMMTTRESGNESEIISALRQRLSMTEKLMSDMSQTWDEKKRHTELEAERRADAMTELKIPVKANKKLPYLMNLMPDEDEGDDGWIMQHICHGTTYVGTEDRDDGIVIQGDGVACHHCLIIYKEGQGVVLHPISGAETSLGDVPVTEPTPLSSGAIIMIGSRMVKFVDPTVPLTARSSRHRLSVTAAARPPSLQPQHNTNSSEDTPAPYVPRLGSINNSIASVVSAEYTSDSQQQQGPQSPPIVPKLAFPVGTSSAGHVDPTAGTTTVGSTARVSATSMFSSARRPETARVPTSISTARGSAEGSLTRRLTLVPRANDDVVLVLKYNLLFVGPVSSGKTCLRKSLFTELRWYESKKCVQTTRTVSIEVEKQTVTVGNDRIDLIMSDVSGCESLLSPTALAFPESRCLIVLTLNLTQPVDVPTLKPWLEALQSRCPACSLYIVGTHKDECRDLDSVFSVLAGVESAVNSYIALLEPEEAHRIQVVGSAAVSNKDRSVSCPPSRQRRDSAPSRLKDLLQVFARHAIEKWRQDADYSGGYVPSRILTLQRKVAEMRATGTWCVSGLEFKHSASLIDPRYQHDVEELALHTQLLHTWRSLLHFRANATLQKHVFFDAELVLRMASHLFAVVFNATAVTASTPMMLTSKDTQELSKGILSVSAASSVFRTFLTQLKKTEKDVKICLEVLCMFDLVFPVYTPGETLLPTTELGRLRQPSLSAVTTSAVQAGPSRSVQIQSTTSTVTPVEYFLVPEVFPGNVPPSVPNCFSDLMHGLHKKYTFNMLPTGFFSRLVCRLARNVCRAFVGPIAANFACQGADACVFWKNAVWLQDSATSRALVRVDRKSIFVSLNTVGSEPSHPCFQLLGVIDNSTKMIAQEYRGIRVEEFVRCIDRDCQHWLQIGKDLHVGRNTHSEVVFCPQCKKAFDHEDVVANKFPSPMHKRVCKHNALQKMASNLSVQLSAAARRELRALADEYYPLGLEEEDLEEGDDDREPATRNENVDDDDDLGSDVDIDDRGADPGPAEELVDLEEVSVLDRVLEVLIGC
eukprot:PhM_4_TR10067/c6_g1_i1/m.103881/K10392/KIF1; kinesin family member 1